MKTYGGYVSCYDHVHEEIKVPVCIEASDLVSAELQVIKQFAGKYPRGTSYYSYKAVLTPFYKEPELEVGDAFESYIAKYLVIELQSGYALLHVPNCILCDWSVSDTLEELSAKLVNKDSFKKIDKSEIFR